MISAKALTTERKYAIVQKVVMTMPKTVGAGNGSEQRYSGRKRIAYRGKEFDESLSLSVFREAFIMKLYRIRRVYQNTPELLSAMGISHKIYKEVGKWQKLN